MKSLLIASLLCLLPLAAPDAQAQWITVGVVAGGGWTTHDVELLDYDHEGRGALGGLQLGLERRVDRLVFGVEADFSLSNVTAEDTVAFNPSPGTSSTTDISHEFRNFSTVRLKVGRAVGAVVPYVTGGWALAKNESSARAVISGFGPLDGNYDDSETATHQGWTLGGGIEFPTTSPFSLKVEYLYADLGEETYTALPTLDPVARTHALTINVLRAGVTVRF